ncbi:hypothetical protein AB1Y20_011896 [Prymnesium parvum]|uniref:Uncharacterized protein n=1 Tax=Prymnesium parvum TaxID=97485 RepID=A0AB34IK74_PRYPA
MSPAATARRVCSLTLLASVLCFTPKPSAHCLLWGADFPLTPLPTEASAASSSPEPSPSLPSASPSSPSSSPASSTTPPDDSPPPVLCRSHSCAAASPVGEGSFHLPLGALAPSGECIPLAAPMPAAAADAAAVRAAPRLGGVEVAARAAECDVWWREVSEDVIPPVPELVLPLGATPHGSRLVLCRTRAEAEGGGGVPRMGTLAVEGPDFGKCFFTREDGGTGVIEGGNFHVLQARPQEPECIDVPAEAERLRRQLLQRVEAYVPPAVRREIEAVAEVPFDDLLAGASSLGSCDLSQILSAARFVPHELNAKGLHGLRAVLAEEMAHARAVARGYDAHPLYATWRRDGILRLNMDDLDDAAIHKLLQAPAALGRSAIVVIRHFS